MCDVRGWEGARKGQPCGVLFIPRLGWACQELRRHKFTPLKLCLKPSGCDLPSPCSQRAISKRQMKDGVHFRSSECARALSALERPAQASPQATHRGVFSLICQSMTVDRRFLEPLEPAGGLGGLLGRWPCRAPLSVWAGPGCLDCSPKALRREA